MSFQVVGVQGYAVVLPVVAFLLARLFAQARSSKPCPNQLEPR